MKDEELAVGPWLKVTHGLFPNDLRVATFLGHVYWLMGECTAARDMWLQVYQQSRYETGLTVFVTQALYTTGEISQAIHIGRSIQGRLPFYSFALGSYNNRSFQTAAEWSEMAVVIEQSADALQLWAKALNKLGQTDRSLAAWKRIIDLTGVDDPLHWAALGQIVYGPT